MATAAPAAKRVARVMDADAWFGVCARPTRTTRMASKWTADANAATCLRLVGAPPPADRVFHPDFTYPIFGDAESIFGYTGLEIGLAFAAGSLTPALSVSYERKNTLTSATLDDVEGTLRAFLPRDVLTHEQLAARAAAEAHSFVPPGTPVASYTKNVRGAPREYTIFHATWDTPGFRAWHAAARILTLFYIEGASYIDDDEPNWEFYLVYEHTDAWHFVGYTSLYRFWCWPHSVRLRLSQFLVLPPYQKQGHGSRLYSTLFDRALADPAICELAVEDPSEAFDHLRDACDLHRIAHDPAIRAAARAGLLRAPLDRAWSAATRRTLKMAPRQWARVLEMLQLTTLAHADAPQLRAYRLQVKARLFRVNREILEQLPRSQRLEKLHETFLAVVDEYAEITGAELPDALLDAPPPSTDSAAELPPAALHFATALIDHGADGDEEEEEEDPPPPKTRRLD